MIQRIMGLCGLHGCGKSHIAKRIKGLLGYEIINKRTYLQLSHQRYKLDPSDEDWESWYRDLYRERGARDVMRMILDEYSLRNQGANGLVVVDAVHNIEEWKLIKETYHAILVLVASPQRVRYQRHPKSPHHTATLDQRRVRYGHADADIDFCLFAQAEWAFSGVMSHKLLDLSINALGQWLQ